MSYSIDFYVIDSDVLSGLLRGETAELDELERTEPAHGGDEAFEHATLKELATEFWSASEERSEVDYLALLNEICGRVGERIDMPEFQGAHWSFFDEVGIPGKLFSPQLPFTVPQGSSRYKPLFASHESLQKHVESTDESDLQHEDAQIQSARYQLHELFESVADDHLDLIGFYG